MNLILAEETLLIALDDRKGRDTSQWGSEVGLAGALLLDLARLELVSVDAEGKVVAVDGAEPGHELVHAAYRVIRESSQPRNADGWVQRLPRELKPLRQRLARELVQRGILSEQHSRRLGVLRTTRFPTVNPAPERDLRERLREVLVAGRDPTEEEALLLGLLEPLGLIDSLVTREERKAARKRAEAVATQGLAGTAVRDAIRAVQAGVLAGVVAATSATTAGSH
ncbi:MAG TPA: GPP34 family phosphoprotein [Solirubrobacteraceae bacterium]|nr:GPP34 family phosphoprotein [Solirubrobacteraceae bacterium]